MAYSNHTTNYNLPQYVGSDKPSYLNDFNGAMNTIDGQMKANANGITANESNIGNLENLTTSEKTNLVGAINEINGGSSVIGDLSDLTTTDKTNVVSAINEVDGNADTNATNIGTLSNLTTTEKSSLVGAINEVDGDIGNLSSLTTTDKTDLVTAINEVKTEEGVIEGILEKLEIHGKYLERNSMGGTSQTLTANDVIKITNYSNSYVNQFTNNEITYSNGTFTIASDKISHVLINAQVFLHTATTLFMYVRKNNGVEVQYTAVSNENRHEVTYFMEVTQGDTIEIDCYVPSSNSIEADKNNFVQIVAF